MTTTKPLHIVSSVAAAQEIALIVDAVLDSKHRPNVEDLRNRLQRAEETIKSQERTLALQEKTIALYKASDTAASSHGDEIINPTPEELLHSQDNLHYVWRDMRIMGRLTLLNLVLTVILLVAYGTLIYNLT